ncbi:hypothetical protein DMC14_002345 [Metamycoplasma phocicerebrale]|uniref:Uncharacterized protein n=1 Tax=Metamycoplasma phocicerebrale TaxID=142649 RepID=A0A3Q9V9E0_9BACT|nr:hypothetical protein [Metamycoplasma phocicerebrale]AZZ65613.2 hypothetical protein DMC14_002345 [Metamycoplasma phocicerebrale]
MKKSLKILTALGALSSIVPISFSLISCENKEVKKLSNTIAELKTKLNGKDLREDQKEKLKVEIEKAEAILNKTGVTAEEAKQAKEALQNSFNEIKNLPDPHTQTPEELAKKAKEELNTYIEELKTKLTSEELKEDQKTKLKVEIEKAEAILNKTGVTAEEAKQAKEALQNSFNEIKNLPDPHAQTPEELAKKAKEELNAYIEELKTKLTSNELREDQKEDLQKAILKAEETYKKENGTEKEYKDAKSVLKTSYEKILSKPEETPKQKALKEFNTVKSQVEKYVLQDLKYDYLVNLKSELEQVIANNTNVALASDATAEKINEAKTNLENKLEEIKTKVSEERANEADKLVQKLRFNNNKFITEIDKTNLDSEILYLMEEGATGSYKDFEDHIKSSVFTIDLLNEKGLSSQSVENKLYSVKWDLGTKTMSAELSIENKKYTVSTIFKFDSPNIEEWFTVLNPKLKSDIDKPNTLPKSINYKSFDLAKEGGKFIYENDSTKPEFIKFKTLSNKTTSKLEQEGKVLISFVFESYDGNYSYTKEVEYEGFKIFSEADLKQNIIDKIANKTIFTGQLDASVIAEIKAYKENAKNGIDEKVFGYIKDNNKTIQYGPSSKKAKKDFTGITWDEDFIQAIKTKKIVRAFKKGGQQANRKALEFTLKDGKLNIVFMFESDKTTPYYIQLEQ